MILENVNTQIDKNLLDYMNGEKNVLRGNEINGLSMRRYHKGGREFTGTYYGDIEDPISYGPNIKRRMRKAKFPVQSEIPIGKSFKTIETHTSRGTGGKEAYTKIMTKHKDKIKGLSLTAKAILLDIFLDGIQWNTGKLIQGRNKKLHTLQTIARLINVCDKTAKTALNELSVKDIIQYDKERKIYFVSTEIARKGVVVEDENKV